MDRILLDIVHILQKFMNFLVATMYGNNGTLYRDTKIRKQTNSSHKAVLILETKLTGIYITKSH